MGATRQIKVLLEMTLFLAIFSSLYFGLNYYVVSRFWSLNGWNTPWLAIVFLTLAFPASAILEYKFGGQLVRIMYTITAIWMGVLFIGFSTLLIFEIVNLFWKIEPQYAVVGIGFIVVSLSIFAAVNAMFVVIKNLDINVKGLKKPIKIAQLSDIHVGTIFNSGYLKKLVRKTNELNPDIVAITGDLVDGSGFFGDKVFKELSGFNAPVYFVSGNHEVYANVSKAVFKGTKVQMLENEAVVVHGLQIVGVSDNGGGNGNRLHNVKFNKKLPTMLMRHQPTLLDEAAESGIDLQLSGHTHHGQIFPFNLLISLQFRPQVGLHKIQDMWLYISPGTGTWGPPMRLGSRNEITILNLK